MFRRPDLLRRLRDIRLDAAHKAQPQQDTGRHQQESSPSHMQQTGRQRPALPPFSQFVFRLRYLSLAVKAPLPFLPSFAILRTEITIWEARFHALLPQRLRQWGPPGGAGGFDPDQHGPDGGLRIGPLLRGGGGDHPGPLRRAGSRRTLPGGRHPGEQDRHRRLSASLRGGVLRRQRPHLRPRDRVHRAGRPQGYPLPRPRREADAGGPPLRVRGPQR